MKRRERWKRRRYGIDHIPVYTMQKEEEKVQQLEGQMIQLWSDRASLLFLPCSDAYHFFCAVDEEEKKDEGDGHKDHLFFLLDISASMNHDEKGTYQAPKSPDHAGKAP